VPLLKELLRRLHPFSSLLLQIIFPLTFPDFYQIVLSFAAGFVCIDGRLVILLPDLGPGIGSERHGWKNKTIAKPKTPGNLQTKPSKSIDKTLESVSPNQWQIQNLRARFSGDQI
jgi:hypothetical protein